MRSIATTITAITFSAVSFLCHGQAMNIFISNADDPQIQSVPEVQVETTIGDLKKMIRDGLWQRVLPESDISLMFAGETITDDPENHDDTLLADIGICSESVVQYRAELDPEKYTELNMEITVKIPGLNTSHYQFSVAINTHTEAMNYNSTSHGPSYTSFDEIKQKIVANLQRYGENVDRGTPITLSMIDNTPESVPGKIVRLVIIPPANLPNGKYMTLNVHGRTNNSAYARWQVYDTHYAFRELQRRAHLQGDHLNAYIPPVKYPYLERNYFGEMPYISIGNHTFSSDIFNVNVTGSDAISEIRFYDRPDVEMMENESGITARVDLADKFYLNLTEIDMPQIGGARGLFV